MPFHEFLLPVRVVFGEGSLGQLGALLPTLAPRTALVVTDPGVAATLSVARVLQQLRGAGVEPALFSAVESNPSVEVVRAGLAAGRQARPDCFIAVGGGSVIDTAKAINLLLAHGGEIEDYVGRDRLTQPLRPLVAIPTTAGTGSEVSMVAIISDRKGRKMVIVDPHLLPWLALVDPEVTYSCPPRLTAIAGMDAITHAVESYTSRRAWDATEALSLHALRLLAAHIHAAVQDGGDRAARRAMAAGSTMTAMGMSYSGVGICHSLANPLTARFGIPHGLACALVLPWAMRFNWPAAPQKFTEAAGVLVGSGPPDDVARRMTGFIARLGLPSRLVEAGVSRDDIPQLAAEAIDNPANQANPRDVTVADLAQVLEDSL